MNGSANDCPGPAVLAMFVEGTLPHDRMGEVVRHLSLCAACRLVVERVAELNAQESETEAGEEPVHRMPSRWLAAAALIACVLAATPLVHRRFVLQKWRGEIAALAAALPRDQRFVEPRLTGGFAWAPFYGPPRQASGAHSSAEVLAAAAAARVLRRVANESSAAALHAKSVALVIAGQTSEAVTTLEALAGTRPRDAALASDLAAALYADAERRRDRAELVRSVAAADRAMVENPELTEARFNRALALERLGERARAAAAWQDYLRHDPHSRWASEAEMRLRALQGDAGEP